MANPPTPAWAGKKNTLCNPVLHCDLPSLPAEVSLFLATQVSVLGLKEHAVAVPAVPSLYRCSMAWPQQGKGTGLSTMDTLPELPALLLGGRALQRAVAACRCKGFIL